MAEEAAVLAGNNPMRFPEVKEQGRRQDDALGGDHSEDKVIFSAVEVGRCRRKPIPPVDIGTRMPELEEIFRQDPTIDTVPVQEQGKIVGYVQRDKFQAFLGRSKFHRDLFMRRDRTIRPVMEKEVVILEARETLYQASDKLMARPPEKSYDPFVVVHHNQYLGMSTVRSVMDGLNKFSARNQASCSSAQEAILTHPETFRADKLDLHYVLEEVDNLGGDLVYYNSIKNNVHIISSLDVSGKGLKASNMVMAILSFLKVSVELFMQLNAKKKNSRYFMKLVNKLNRLVADNTPFDMYATGVFFWVDSRNQVMDYYDFGHTPVYILRNGKVRALPTKENRRAGVQFFGLDRDLLIGPSRIRLKAGDKIFVHSDGLNEQRNREEEEFGEDRIVEYLGQWADLSLEQINENFKKTLENYRGRKRVIDDLTILTFALPQ